MIQIKVSQQANEAMEQLRRATGIGRNIWARAALAKSLALPGAPDFEFGDSSGSELREPTLFGNDAGLMLGLLREREGRRLPDDEINHLTRAHVERGLQLILADYHRLNRRGDELVLELIRSVSTGGPTDPAAGRAAGPAGLVLRLGVDVRGGQSVTHVLNGPGSSPHVAVMGRSGTGKTRTALGLLQQIREGPRPPRMLLFDYAKGDIAGDHRLRGALGAALIKPPEQMIPISPLALFDQGVNSETLAARRFRDTVASVVRLGAKQRDRCLRIIETAFVEHGTPDLAEVAEVGRRIYADEDWEEDSLIACLRDFGSFQLFQPGAEGAGSALAGSMVVDLHELPEDLRRLAVFLTLDRLSAELSSLPDSPADPDGNRELRVLVLIDEAHHFLPCRQPTLERLVREGRSKGLSVWLLSQSPDDFDQRQYNFTHEMGLSVAFACVLDKPAMLRALLGGDVAPERMSRLPAGVALTRPSGATQPLEVRFWSPAGTGKALKPAL